MKKIVSDTEKPRFFLYDILFGAAGVLFLLVMLSLWLICGMFAKYVITDSNSDAARVAAFAGVEVLEHEAVLKDGVYVLLDDTNSPDYSEVSKNTYSKVIPGVDIPKDPFVRLSGTVEVSCALYLKVEKSKNFPDTITYEIDDAWKTTVYGNVYKYKDPILAGTVLENLDTIPILKKIGDNDYELKVSENYYGLDEAGNPIEFSLTFSVWLVQIH